MLRRSGLIGTFSSWLFGQGRVSGLVVEIALQVFEGDGDHDLSGQASNRAHASDPERSTAGCDQSVQHELLSTPPIRQLLLDRCGSGRGLGLGLGTHNHA